MVRVTAVAHPAVSPEPHPDDEVFIVCEIAGYGAPDVMFSLLPGVKAI
jgi:hypothetical protein